MLSRFVMTVWRAATDARSYIEDFGKRRTGSGVGYLYWLCVTLAFFGLLPFAIGLAVLAPNARTFADTQLTVLQDWYPDELVLTITGGTLSTNVNEPYVLDLPNEWRLGETEKTHLLTIDTAGSIEDFESYDTAVLLTGAAAVTRDDSGLRVIPFSEFDEGIVINESLMSELTTALRGITPSLPWIAWGLVLALLLALPWIVGGLTWAMNLFFLLWGTVLVWIASNLMGRGMRYGELYRLGLFGVTGSVLLSFAFSMTGLELPLVAYLAFFGWMLYVLSTFPRRERADAAPLPPAQTLKKTPPKKPRA